jgi:hypothetical protein
MQLHQGEHFALTRPFIEYLAENSKYRSDLYSLEEARASLVKEIEIMARLSHPNGEETPTLSRSCEFVPPLRKKP